MAMATMNPIRLTDARLMATGELLLPPGQDMSWLPDMPRALAAEALRAPEGDAALTLVLAAPKERLRCGLVLRLSLRDPHIPPAACAEAREQLMAFAASWLTEQGAAPTRPLGSEGVFCCLPREGLRFMRRSTPDAALTQPVRLDMTALESLLLSHPDSGLCLTLLPCDDFALIFTCAVWGTGAQAIADLLIQSGLPLVCSSPMGEADLLPGFEFLYDPWKLAWRLQQEAALPTRTTPQELQLLFGERKPVPAAAQPAASPYSGAARQLAQGVLGSLPDLTRQMRASARSFRDGVQQQVKHEMDEAIGSVQRQLNTAAAQLQELPGAQQTHLTDVLTRLNERISHLSPDQAAQEVANAGFNQPLDALTLMKMGFSGEQELLDLGLTVDLLPLLRAAVALHDQCPASCTGEQNCMPYAFMIGYLYEALVGSRFFQAHKHSGGERQPTLVDYSKVSAERCEKLASFGRFRDPALRRLNARDWAAWLNLFDCTRLMRNRQHSDKGVPGFITREEMEAFFSLMLFPGQMAKLDVLRLPAYGKHPPRWSKRFTPQLPQELFGAPTGDDHAQLQQHISRNISAFTPSLLRMLLSSGDLLPGEGRQ